ncbi:hypothetical protein [Pseudalkalibacillus caeni]|nr:hypothetical protein [Pseudalkalibacillus caeni]
MKNRDKKRKKKRELLKDLLKKNLKNWKSKSGKEPASNAKTSA